MSSREMYQPETTSAQRHCIPTTRLGVFSYIFLGTDYGYLTFVNPALSFYMRYRYMARMRLTVKGECEEKCHKSAAEQKKTTECFEMWVTAHCESRHRKLSNEAGWYGSLCLICFYK